MITAFHQQITPILAWGERYIEQVDDLSRDGPNLHVRKILSDTAEGAR